MASFHAIEPMGKEGKLESCDLPGFHRLPAKAPQTANDHGPYFGNHSYKQCEKHALQLFSSAWNDSIFYHCEKFSDISGIVPSAQMRWTVFSL